MDQNQGKDDVDFLVNMVKAVVDKPEKVSVDKEIDGRGVKLTLKVDPSDMGRVIGSQGRMGNSIRTIMHAYGGQKDVRISVVIDEPEGRQQR